MTTTKQNTTTMTTLEKIQSVLTPMEINIILVDHQFVIDEFRAQDINSKSFKQIYEMTSVRTEKLLNKLHRISFKMGITVLPNAARFAIFGDCSI